MNIYIDNVNNEGFSWSVKTNQQLTNNNNKIIKKRLIIITKIHNYCVCLFKKKKSNSITKNKSKLFPYSTQIPPSRLDVYGLVKILPSNLYFSHLFIYFCLDTSNVRRWVPYSHTHGPSFLPENISNIQNHIEV